jgi:F0F1-type ATP synthase delta subunit
MPDNKLGTEKIETLATVLTALVIAGKKVKADGKVDVNDLQHVIALVPQLSPLADIVSNFGDLIAEGKDLDVAEVVTLIQLVDKKVKEVEAA